MSASEVHYSGYRIKPFQEGTGAKLAKRARRFIARRVICDTLLLPYGLAKQKHLKGTTERVSNHTYTCFLRSPSQLELLTGLVADTATVEDRLNVTLMACSNGAEAYTMVSWLRMHRPELDVRVDASDIHGDLLEYARAGSYTMAEVMHGEYVTPEFIEATFGQRDGRFQVHDEIRDRVTFSKASLLDDDVVERFGQRPLVVAQNVLFHLTDEDARTALGILKRLTTPGGILMIEGMDLDLREEVSRDLKLEPVTANLEKIHAETRNHTPPDWWNYYWGSEPFRKAVEDPSRRYSTIFKVL